MRFQPSTSKDEVKREPRDLCGLFRCPKTYKIRPEHKYLTHKNKFHKTYLGKKRCRVRRRLSVWWVIFENILHRVKKQGLNHPSHERGMIIILKYISMASITMISMVIRKEKNRDKKCIRYITCGSYSC